MSAALWVALSVACGWLALHLWRSGPKPVETHYRLRCTECEWGCTVTSKNVPERLVLGGVDRLLQGHADSTGHMPWVQA